MTWRIVDECREMPIKSLASVQGNPFEWTNADGLGQISPFGRSVGRVLVAIFVTQNILSLTLASHSLTHSSRLKPLYFPKNTTTHTRLSRYVSKADGNNSSSLGGGGGGGQPSSRSSRTPSFQADVRQKLNSSSRTPSFNRTTLGYETTTKPTAGQSSVRGGGSGGGSGDRNRTSSISEKRPSISAFAAGAAATAPPGEDNNCSTESNRGDDVNRQHRNSLVSG